MLKKIIVAGVAIITLNIIAPTAVMASELDGNEYFFINDNDVEVEVLGVSANNAIKIVNFSDEVFPLEIGASILNHTLNVYNNQFCYIDPTYISYGIPEIYEFSQSTQNIKSLGVHKVTTYCSCAKCCGKTGGKVTAAGTIPTVGRTIGCNWLPLGTHVLIEGHEYIVEDRGASWVKGFDIFWGNDHHAALHSGFGRKIEVFIIE